MPTDSNSPNWEEMVSAVNGLRNEVNESVNSRFNEILKAVESVELRVFRTIDKMEDYVKQVTENSEKERERLLRDVDEKFQERDKRINDLYAGAKWLLGLLAATLVGLVANLAKDFILR